MVSSSGVPKQLNFITGNKNKLAEVSSRLCFPFETERA
jgi:hypothetical protein